MRRLASQAQCIGIQQGWAVYETLELIHTSASLVFANETFDNKMFLPFMHIAVENLEVFVFLSKEIRPSH